MLAGSFHTRLQKELKQKKLLRTGTFKELNISALARLQLRLFYEKKALAIWGRRGRRDQRLQIAKMQCEAIDENGKKTGPEKMACHELGISQRTLQRWRERGRDAEDQRPGCESAVPKNKLTEGRTSCNCVAIADSENLSKQLLPVKLSQRWQIR